MSDFYFPAFDEFDLDETERSLCEYFMRLKCLVEKAASEFDYVTTTTHELAIIRDAISNEYDAMVRSGMEELQPGDGVDLTAPQSIALQLIYTPGLGAAEIREQSALLRAESSAGSLILMLDDAVQRLRRSVWNATQKTPQAGSFHVGTLVGIPGYAATLIYAAGNAYRHVKGWDGLVSEAGVADRDHLDYGDSKRTLDILDATIGLKAVAASATCIETLSTLSTNPGSAPSFAALWDGRLSDIGRDFARIYCKQSDAFDRVSEALSYQDSITSMEVSYSNDERLWGGEGSEW